MHLAVEGLIAFCMVFYYWLEAIVLFFVPAKFRSKDVKGQLVLITGAGKSNYIYSSGKEASTLGRVLYLVYCITYLNLPDTQPYNSQNHKSFQKSWR